MGKVLLLIVIVASIFTSYKLTNPKFKEGDCVKLVDSKYSSFGASCYATVVIAPLNDTYCTTEGIYCYVLGDIVCDGTKVGDESFDVIVGQEVLSKSITCPEDTLEKVSEVNNVIGIY